MLVGMLHGCRLTLETCGFHIDDGLTCTCHISMVPEGQGHILGCWLKMEVRCCRAAKSITKPG